jgi:hypothetical protein
MSPANSDNPVLQWLAEHFQASVTEFREFIEEKYSAVA